MYSRLVLIYPLGWSKKKDFCLWSGYGLVTFSFKIDWPNSLDCTDLNQCGARRDTELCRLCYKENLYLLEKQNKDNFVKKISYFQES